MLSYKIINLGPVVRFHLSYSFVELKCHLVKLLDMDLLLTQESLFQLRISDLSEIDFLVKLLDVQTELVNDAPGNHMLPCKPCPSFLIVCFPEEDAKMQQVPELIALEDIDIHPALFL